MIPFTKYQQDAARQQKAALDNLYGTDRWGRSLFQSQRHQELYNDLNLLINDPQAYNRKAALANERLLAQQANQQANPFAPLQGSSSDTSRPRRNYSGIRTHFSVPAGGQGTPRVDTPKESRFPEANPQLDRPLVVSRYATANPFR